MDEQPESGAQIVTPADVAEANARAGLAGGTWGFYVQRGRGFGKGKAPSAPVRSQIENGAIPWVDTYLESESAFRTPLDPRMLQPATPEPPKNRAERRERPNRTHIHTRGQRGRRRR